MKWNRNERKTKKIESELWYKINRNKVQSENNLYEM